MAAERRIQNEDQYFNSLMWLVEKAEQIEDPLLDEATKKMMMKQYDFVSLGILRYRRGELVKKYPKLRQVYRVLGWEFDDHDPTPGQQLDHQSDTKVAEQRPANREETKQEYSSDPYSWLDDD